MHGWSPWIFSNNFQTSEISKRIHKLKLQSIRFSTIPVYILSWKSHWLSSNLVNLIEKIFRKKSGCGGHPWLVRTQSRMRCGLALATKNFRFRSRPDRGKGHDHFICSITFWLLDVQLKKDSNDSISKASLILASVYGRRQLNSVH